jgi:hypothetical protein
MDADVEAGAADRLARKRIGHVGFASEFDRDGRMLGWGHGRPEGRAATSSGGVLCLELQAISSYFGRSAAKR